ncbi:nucleoside monophosphate kinase [Leptolyngbya iicbica]|uniref:Adenylate kinase n=2 Tax=Cyanophyceae TaxID=3028117 RepID=A0A4Q7E8L0_9CYAN|nr:nucleoside monophosphate kinase [Leptolyngbya sp. LK]RZM78888.1 adenylate kinase [Leptolyngbya sp. LK]
METTQLILLAPPGARGAEHAAALAQQWAVPQVSMSELLQQAIADGSAIATELRPYLAAGEPLPDELALKLIKRRLEQPDTVLHGWVIEGFPRSVGQAQGLNTWWTTMGRPLPTVVYLKAMAGILMNRLAAEPGQTATTPALKRCLEQYQAEVAPLVEYYQQQAQLTTLNANLSFAEVARDLAAIGQPQSSAAPLIEDEAELDTLIYGESRLVVDCMAPWCGSCKQVSPFIDQLAEEYRDRVNVMKINFDANRQISKRFGLQGIPAVLYFKNGQLQTTLTGVKSYAEYNNAIARLLQ